MTERDIDSVHSVRGIPHTEVLTPYPSIRSLVDSQVRRYGEKTFLITYDNDGNRVELSYNDFSGKVFQAANFLRGRNVMFGHRVAVKRSRGLTALLEIFAIWTLGGVAVLAEEVDVRQWPVIRKGSGASPVLEKLHGQFLETIDGLSPRFRMGKKSRIHDDVLFFYTPVAEGKAKGIRLTHYNLLAEAMGVARRLGITDSSIVVCGVPVTDLTGIAGCVMPVLYEGGTVVISDDVADPIVSRLIASEQARTAFVGKSFLSGLHEESHMSATFPSSLKCLTAPARDLSLPEITAIRKRLGIQVITGVALPEAASFASLVPVIRGGRGELLAWLESQNGIPAGKALHAAEMTVLDRQGSEREENQEGEIVVRGHSVMAGYLKDDRATARAFRFGWQHTGIRGFYRSSGGEKYFFVTS